MENRNAVKTVSAKVVLCLMAIALVFSCVPAAVTQVAQADDADVCTVTWHYRVLNKATQQAEWAVTSTQVKAGSSPSAPSIAGLESSISCGDGVTYKLKKNRWNTAEDGGETLRSDNFPAVQQGESARGYWACYGKETLTFSLKFVANGVEYTALNVLSTATVDTVWAGDASAFKDGQATWANGNAPAGDPVYSGDKSNMKFVGWSSVKDSDTLYKDQLKDGSIFYPVFSVKDSCETTFWLDAGKTEKRIVKVWEGEDPAETLIYTPTDYGKVFTGWVDANGNEVTSIPADRQALELFPRFEEIGTYGDEDAYAEIDASEAYVSTTDVDADIDTRHARGADAQNLKVWGTVSSDNALVKQATADNYKLIDGYNVFLRWSESNTKFHYIESGFGKLTASFYVAGYSGFKLRAYWLRADGSIGYVDKTLSGKYKLNLSSLDMDGDCNVIIAIANFNSGTGDASGKVDSGGSASSNKKTSSKKTSSKKSNTKSSGKVSTASTGSSSGGGSAVSSGNSGYSLSNLSNSSASSNAKTGAWALSGDGSDAYTDGLIGGSGDNPGLNALGGSEESAQASAEGLQQQAASSADLGVAGGDAGSDGTEWNSGNQNPLAFLWPWILIPVFAAALVALFLVYRKQHAKSIAAVEAAPLSEAETDDVSRANF